ncbi:GNAT family N-acetyltransferase [Halorubrum sp. PV6]|uniref:GNAT family N-acetyltransferase n=1 Tax=Halorubrum sp. PV6 TaxID=634157 RepID=UPI001FCE308A|nr:GNAT family N-acetyltransferase [Halorubrum sp. PV6]
MTGDGSAGVPDGVAIEPATPEDRLDSLRVLNAAMLETDSAQVAERIDAGDALVARFKKTGAVVGALVATRPEPSRYHVDAVAVRRARRGRGIGSALVAAAVERAEREEAVAVVTAAFDAKLRGFYTDLGFAVVPDTETQGAGRLRGRRAVDGGAGADDSESGERRR